MKKKFILTAIILILSLTFVGCYPKKQLEIHQLDIDSFRQNNYDYDYDSYYAFTANFELEDPEYSHAYKMQTDSKTHYISIGAIVHNKFLAEPTAFSYTVFLLNSNKEIVEIYQSPNGHYAKSMFREDPFSIHCSFYTAKDVEFYYIHFFAC